VPGIAVDVVGVVLNLKWSVSDVWSLAWLALLAFFFFKAAEITEESKWRSLGRRFGFDVNFEFPEAFTVSGLGFFVLFFPFDRSSVTLVQFPLFKESSILPSSCGST
jgi:hypothetical protein